MVVVGLLGGCSSKSSRTSASATSVSGTGSTPTATDLLAAEVCHTSATLTDETDSTKVSADAQALADADVALARVKQVSSHYRQLAVDVLAQLRAYQAGDDYHDPGNKIGIDCTYLPRAALTTEP
ncbi:MAG: hypothetical protein ACHQNA_00110 [Acidimicrobiales bacterium]